jgi:hypothetical protein
MDLGAQVLDEVFMSAFIPQRLDQISLVDAEKDIKRAAQGEDVLHRKITGMNETMTGAAVGRDSAPVPRTDADESEDEAEAGAEVEAEASDEDGSEADSDGGDGEQDGAFKEWLQSEEEQLALLRQALAVVSASPVRPKGSSCVANRHSDCPLSLPSSIAPWGCALALRAADGCAGRWCRAVLVATH